MLSSKDLVVLGMMIFALFLGAGNIIFPPMEGYNSGSSWAVASLGFVITGVIMPFIALVVVSIRGRGEELSRDLPKWAEVIFWSILYLSICSAFAAPRVINVAYEMAWLPLNITDNSHPYSQLIFAVAFSLISMGLLLQGSLVSSVGKIMTPALLVLLVAVAVYVIKSPLSEIQEPAKAYATNPALTTGLISGYQTLDLLAAIAFGSIVSSSLSAKNVTDKGKIVKYTMAAGSVSVVLLAALYFSLFYLGATSHQVAQGATNGGQIFASYVNQLFGSAGVWIMSGIVILANLTTLVGVTGACASYFSRLIPSVSYIWWVVIFSILTTIVSQVGLTQLLVITIPALLLIYPVAIMLVALQFVRSKLPSIKLSYYATLLVTVFFSTIDSLNYAKLLPESINETLKVIPLYADGLAWLIPALITLAVTMILGKCCVTKK